MSRKDDINYDNWSHLNAIYDEGHPGSCRELTYKRGLEISRAVDLAIDEYGETLKKLAKT